MIKELFADAIFPRRCAICDTVIGRNDYLCSNCAKTVRPIERATCYRCGKSLEDETLYCYDCRRKIHYFDRNFAIFEYRDVKQSLYRFKYSGRAEYARFYAMAAGKYVGETLRSLKADAIIPVPIHKSRREKRGYNQAEELARELSYRIDVPLMTDFVLREKATVPLKELGEKERRNNLKKAFIIGRNDVKLKTIIIVDDIYTTGATLDAISCVCRRVGVRKIFCLTVAIGRGI